MTEQATPSPWVLILVWFTLMASMALNIGLHFKLQATQEKISSIFCIEDVR